MVRSISAPTIAGLLIATPADQGFVVVDAFSRIVRLGERLGQTGRLSDAAMARTIDALRVCANKLQVAQGRPGRGWSQPRPAAWPATAPTSSRAWRPKPGLALEIIDRETEARLAAVGAEPLVDGEAETALVFDIGGGSTEVLWLQRKGQRFETVAWTSLAAGVVTISERFGGGMDVTPRVLRGHVRLSAADAAGLRAAALRPSPAASRCPAICSAHRAR